MEMKYQPRIVTRPETLRIGDYIQVEYPAPKDGRTILYRGVIGHREHIGAHHTGYLTQNEDHLFTTGPDLKLPRITLLEPAKELDVALFEIGKP